MHTTKKKTAKLPKPIKVKKEKSDEDRLPQPMSHYIDDRLELVKQVFGSLKPKTIINLAPEFLKSQGLEEIEEACLHELLCISTKRLKSIITATKCPTDTESSDDNDDVQRKEAHVSLEEISSDSEIEEGGTSKKAKTKKSLKSGDKTKTEKSKTIEGAANPEDGQISVLELLELQARARAIRSQLALEPVTKIEVDSEGDVAADKGKDGKEKSMKDKKSRKTSERTRTSSARESQDSSNTKSTENERERITKKIKLKRNYRTASSSTTQGREDETRPNAEIPAEMENKPTQGNGSNKNQDQNRASEKLKKERSSRSVSPDVIPIVAEPETLLINDSSDEVELKDNQSNKAENEPEKAGTNDATETEKNDEAMERDKTSQPEERELCTETDEVSNQVLSKSLKEDTELEKEPIDTKTKNVHDNSNSNLVSENKEQNDLEKSAMSDQPNSAKSVNYPAGAVEEDEDRNEDVISLGEDLEDEMNEQLENEVNASSFKADNLEVSSSEKSKKKSRKEKPEKTTSEDDQKEDNQSWHSRYMKSSKVSKVLAASRLGKRVRDKIKKSKDVSRETNKAEKKEPVFSSKHEDGSLDQYKELLELRNRKSK